MSGWTILKSGTAVVALAALVSVAKFYDFNLFEGAQITQVIVGPPGTVYEGTEFIVLLRESPGLIYVVESNGQIYVFDSLTSIKVTASYYQLADSGMGVTHIMRIEDLENGFHTVITPAGGE